MRYMQCWEFLKGLGVELQRVCAWNVFWVECQCVQGMCPWMVQRRERVFFLRVVRVWTVFIDTGVCVLKLLDRLVLLVQC